MRFLPTRRRISWSFREAYGLVKLDGRYIYFLMNFSINVSLKGKILNYEFLIGYNYKLEKLTLAHVLTEFILR